MSAKHTALLLGVIGPLALARVAAAQYDPTPEVCTMTAWFETGHTYGPATYYIGSHVYTGQATFIFSGWSNTITSGFADRTTYPFPSPMHSTDNQAVAKGPWERVDCFHYAAGYDAAVAFDMGAAEIDPYVELADAEGTVPVVVEIQAMSRGEAAYAAAELVDVSLL